MNGGGVAEGSLKGRREERVCGMEETRRGQRRREKWRNGGGGSGRINNGTGEN